MTAAGSRSLDQATTWAARDCIEGADGLAEALAARDDVDMMHIAFLRASLRPDDEVVLNVGQVIRIEKATTTTVGDAAAAISLTRTHGLLAMNGTWPSRLPQSEVMRQRLDARAIGLLQIGGAKA